MSGFVAPSPFDTEPTQRICVRRDRCEVIDLRQVTASPMVQAAIAQWRAGIGGDAA